MRRMPVREKVLEFVSEGNTNINIPFDWCKYDKIEIVAETAYGFADSYSVVVGPQAKLKGQESAQFNGFLNAIRLQANSLLLSLDLSPSASSQKLYFTVYGIKY